VLYDLFICHASEDKDAFVRPLASALAAQHVEVWYDEFSLELGDSIRRTIDAGLAQSRFGVVVLSPSFFQKRWTQYELDGLTEVEMRGRDKVLLPVWHKVTHSDVVAQSPSLANRKAVMSSDGLETVVAAILRVVRPQSSPLIAARDLLLQWGVTPPVITDSYWLEITEASNRVDAFGASVPDESVWGRWTFPLPPKVGGPKQWGERLAWTALQIQWSDAAENERISPLTPPDDVHEFIGRQPGLYETCEMFPQLLVEYAPQLVIPGMSGGFDQLFSVLYQRSVERQIAKRERGDTGGTALTTDGDVPLCDEEWALRDSEFGRYSPGHIAGEYFSGGIFGPPVSPYEHADHLAWLLSKASNWLPKTVHEVLLDGMASWRAWHWTDGDWSSAGALADALFKEDRGVLFRWSKRRKDDVRGRLGKSIIELGLPETSETLLERFIEYDIPRRWIEQNEKHRPRNRSRA
jgi:hypothetical protein